MSLWDAFTGGGARRYATNAMTENRNQLNEGYRNNLGYQREGYQSAINRLSPYEAYGRQGQQAYTNLLGLNGAGPQGQARGAYEGWNTYLQGGMDQATQAVARRAAASGQMNSGMNALAQDRVTRQMGTQDFYNYADRLQGLGQQGYGAANALAGLDTNNAANLIGIENATRSGNIQNMTNYFNAHSQANQGMLNNMMGLGGLALQFALPGVGGASAFGNIANGMSRMFGGGANSYTGQVPVGQSGY